MKLKNGLMRSWVLRHIKYFALLLFDPVENGFPFSSQNKNAFVKIIIFRIRVKKLDEFAVMIYDFVINVYPSFQKRETN